MQERVEIITGAPHSNEVCLSPGRGTMVAVGGRAGLTATPLVAVGDPTLAHTPVPDPGPIPGTGNDETSPIPTLVLPRPTGTRRRRRGLAPNLSRRRGNERGGPVLVPRAPGITSPGLRGLSDHRRRRDNRWMTQRGQKKLGVQPESPGPDPPLLELTKRAPVMIERDLRAE